MNKDLNDDNFLMYAIKNYKNPGMTGMSELEDDLKRFKYLKRLFNRYLKTGEPNERLIINHLIYFTMFLVMQRRRCCSTKQKINIIRY